MFKLILAALAATQLQQAQDALQSKDYTKATAIYQTILQEDQQSYEALYGLARSQAFAGDYATAVETYTQVLALYPDDPDALFGRGQAYIWLKQDDLGQTDLRNVLLKNPGYQDAWQGLANLYRWRERTDDAIALYEEWLIAHPDRSEPLVSRAYWYFQQRQFNLARTDLIQARELGANAEQVDPLLTRLNRQPGALPWEVRAIYEFQAFSENNVPWHTGTGAVQYTFDRGSVSLEGLATQRFGKNDQGLAVDSFLDLWPGAYGNFRVQGVLDAEVMPQWDLLGEIYQSFLDTWEVSGAYRLMNYPTNNVHIIHGSVGKYIGNWYLRAQPQLILSPEGPGGIMTLWGRYYYNTVDDFVELRTGFGRRIAVIGSDDGGAQLQGQSNIFGVLTGQYFINPQLGFLGTLNYNHDDLFPNRFGFSLGTKYRF